MESVKAYAKKNFSPTTMRYLYIAYRSLPNRVKSILRRNMSERPRVSCICPTYGRVDLLEEAIYSFITQDYSGPKELIILNDYAQQTLAFDHPEVRIINIPKRLHTLGEKYKAAVGLCSYNLIFVWHDDDIYLPHRLSYSVKHHYAHEPNFKPKKTKSFFSADKAWLWDGQQLRGPATGRFPGSSSWTRSLFTAVRGYAHINYGYDEELETQFAKKVPSLNIDDVEPRDIYYIQRQGGNSAYQLRDFAGDAAGDDYGSVANFVQGQAERGEIKQGHIELEPKWHVDYSKLVRHFLQEEKSQGLGK